MTFTSPSRAHRLSLLTLALSSVYVTQSAQAQDTAPVKGDTVLETVVSTGNRGDQRTVADSPAPVDVISAEQLKAVSGGASDLRDALSKMLPSFQVNTSNNQSGSSVQRPAQLRGLSLAHVLVLVNGKRRHNTATANNNPASQASGANPVDLDLIPVSAIDHIEVLRDGAAAQYGSDAIAGVINIILKQNDNGGTAITTLGERYRWKDRNDGDTYTQSINHGFALPNNGFLNLSLDAKKQNWSLRNGDATGNFYFPGDPREATVDKRVNQGGLPKIDAENFGYNAELPLNDDVSLYSFSTYSHREAQVGQSFRLPNSTSYIPQIYGDSIMQPSVELAENDYQAAAGIKGDNWHGWHWDLSSTYGRDRTDFRQVDTVNPSLGPSSPTSFNTYAAEYAQWTNNLDLTRAFDIGLRNPVQVSWGLEQRRERYQTIVHDPLAYADGGYRYPSGPLAGSLAAVGAQGGVTILPEDAADLTRNSYAGYLDLGFDFTDRWFVGVAGRAEHYDDSSGDTTNGKLSTRYKLTDELNLRGTLSNGFRAPSLSQTGFASSSKGYNASIGPGLTTTRLVRPDSALGAALGAKDLTPEKSTNYSLGLSFTPNERTNLSVDAYQIILKDRIAQTGYLSGAGVNQILTANGFAASQSVSYYANAIDTKTSGVDVVGNYLQDVGAWGSVRWDAALNWNETKITSIKDTPSQLANLNLSLFNRVAQGYITDYNPKTKLILGGNWKVDAWDVNLHLTRYGRYDLITSATSSATDQHYGANWVTDLDVAYALTKSITIALGANNLFNVYPDKSTVVDSSGAQLYASNSPFGQYGGFYYGRLEVKF
jgi:iron complex outermembrane receptor protein